MFQLAIKTIETIRTEGFDAVLRKIRYYLESRRGIRNLKNGLRDYDKWLAEGQGIQPTRSSCRNVLKHLAYRPRFSIVMPVFNVAEKWLHRAIESVCTQYYEEWELCIAVDVSAEEHIRPVLERYALEDGRVKFKILDKYRDISGVSNEALSLATGEHIGFLNPEDELTPDALFENILLLNQHRDADFIYSDEDKLTRHNKRCQPFFKPDWSPDLLLCYMYTGHFSIFRKHLLDKLGGIRAEYDGSQEYDLVLRLIEITDRIYHIPKVLYHRRMVSGRTTDQIFTNNDAAETAKQALRAHMKRNGIDGEVRDGLFAGSFRVQRKINGLPMVSILIPFKDRVDDLMRCLTSIMKKTTYGNYRIVLIDNGSRDENTHKYLKTLNGFEFISILSFNEAFNFSKMNNFAVSETESEYILFLNNDTEIITPEWIEAMLEHAQREEVGCVGALLYYPDDTVQHGGVICGLQGVAGHAHSRWHRSSYGYMGRLKVVNNFSAVTAACMMMRRTVFDEAGGFDEDFSHSFNDVDLCLKLREREYIVVYTPYAELYHYESSSRGYDDTPNKQKRFLKECDLLQKRWNRLISAGDPYYNPNLTLNNGSFSIRL